MTFAYSPDSEKRTTIEALEYIKDFKGKSFTAVLAREFAAKIDKIDWKLTNQLEETIDESTDMRAVTKANLNIDDCTRALNKELAEDGGLTTGVERFIQDIIDVFEV